MSGLLTVIWLLPRLIGGSLLPWYYLEQPRQIIKHYRTYATALNEVLSPWFLLRTLACPWKSIADKYPANLLRLGEWLQVLTLNITSRVIGLIVRIPLLLLGLALQLLLLAGCLVYLLVWFVYPALLITTLVYFKVLMRS